MPNKISIFPLNGALLLPRSQLPLNIFEPRYLEMIDNSVSSDRVIGMIQTQESNDNRLYSTGCVGRITSFTELPDSRLIITLNGICRYKVIEELDALTPYRQVKVSYSDFESCGSGGCENRGPGTFKGGPAPPLKGGPASL